MAANKALKELEQRYKKAVEDLAEKTHQDRAARIYPSNKDANRALGIAPGSFSRLCRLYGIDTPRARRQRRRANL
ncbi:MAG: hypothetical protein ACI906_000960 [Candidatus Latescibacterota bacterium]|jgi:hypothetical protein